jgi:hypothetical protein
LENGKCILNKWGISCLPLKTKLQVFLPLLLLSHKTWRAPPLPFSFAFMAFLGFLDTDTYFLPLTTLSEVEVSFYITVIITPCQSLLSCYLINAEWVKVTKPFSVGKKNGRCLFKVFVRLVIFYMSSAHITFY